MGVLFVWDRWCGTPACGIYGFSNVDCLRGEEVDGQEQIPSGRDKTTGRYARCPEAYVDGLTGRSPHLYVGDVAVGIGDDLELRNGHPRSRVGVDSWSERGVC